LYFFSSIFLFFCLLLARIDRYFYKANDSFCVNAISSKIPLSFSWQQPAAKAIDPHIQTILSQPFLYLTKGKQCFVFASQDGQYVLKLLRMPAHLRPFARPFVYRGNEEKLRSTLRSFAYAFADLRGETRLLCVNYPLNQIVEIHDKLGRTYPINLCALPWILQERGDRFFSRLEQWIGNEEICRTIIDKTIALYTSCHAKGYIDKDPLPYANFGLQGAEPMILDVGRLAKEAESVPLHEYLLKMTEPLRFYLEKASPPLHAYYMQKCRTF
jgi:hypothetical protein